MVFVVAIDGPACSGKGTISSRAADILDFGYLDTGILYRMVAAWFIKLSKGNDNSKIQLDEAIKEVLIILQQEGKSQKTKHLDLRSEEVSNMASKVAKDVKVREALIDYQRNFPINPPGGKKGVIVDGRDIATKVLPNANVKIFITADIKVRARRRYEQLCNKGLEISYKKVYEDLDSRDKADASRVLSPLRIVEGALVIDTSLMCIEEATDKVLKIIREELFSQQL